MEESLLSISLKNTLTIFLMVAVGAGIFYGAISLIRQQGADANG